MHFNEKEILKLFRRTRNVYCDAHGIPCTAKKNETEARRFLTQNDNLTDKWKSVVLRSNRIEFRAIGNYNYHLRHADLESSISHMVSCVKRSHKIVTA